MSRISRALLTLLPTLALLFSASLSAFSQSSLVAPRSRILQVIDDNRVTTLSGNIHPLARAEFDQGALADAASLRRMVLVLQRSSEQEAALQQLIDQQQDKSSAAYHQWLTPQSFGATFGPSDHDLTVVTAWLSGHGFNNIQVNPGRTLIEFSGTAGMMRTAFRTSVHRYAVRGEQHFANASDPQIPVALAPVVAGIASLNNFARGPASHRVGNFRHDSATHLTTRIPDLTVNGIQPAFTFNSGSNTVYGVTPYDFATIYNVLPLWNASTPIDGTGQTIAIVGQTDINPADFVNFRKLFNLPLGNTATPTGTEYLNILYNGPNPGVTSDEGESDIDTQWSAAVAKAATIDYVVSEGAEVTQGTDLSAIYIVNNNLAPVMSYSYGECELFLGSAGNAFYKTLWQQAAAQGITVLLASGDSGAAGCDVSGAVGASDGLAVSGLSSTPYNISVGALTFTCHRVALTIGIQLMPPTMLRLKGIFRRHHGTKAARIQSSPPLVFSPDSPPSRFAIAVLPLRMACSLSLEEEAAAAPARSPTALPIAAAKVDIRSHPGRPEQVFLPMGFVIFPMSLSSRARASLVRSTLSASRVQISTDDRAASLRQPTTSPATGEPR
jgi:hypothetical protein